MKTDSASLSDQHYFGFIVEDRYLQKRFHRASDPTLLFYLYEGLKAILGGVSTGTSSVILSLGLVMIPARTASDEAGDVYTLSEFINLSDENASLYTQLKTAKEKALASTKTPLFPTNRHHIVAQFDIRAKPSWPILKKANINRFYDEENIVQVSTKMHWYMHTNLYHDSVYGVLYIADQWPLGEYSCNVRFALGTIKVLIEAIDQAE